MAPETVTAVWHGPYEGDLGPGHAPLKIGDTYEVSPEFLESGHWTAVNPVVSATPAPATPAPAAPFASGGAS